MVSILHADSRMERCWSPWTRLCDCTAWWALIAVPDDPLPPRAAQGPGCEAPVPERDDVNTCAISNVRNEVEDSLQELPSGWRILRVKTRWLGAVMENAPAGSGEGETHPFSPDLIKGTVLGLALSSVSMSMKSLQIYRSPCSPPPAPWEPQRACRERMASGGLRKFLEPPRLSHASPGPGRCCPFTPLCGAPTARPRVTVPPSKSA